MRHTLLAAVAAVSLMTASAASAQMTHYSAVMKGAGSAGTGAVHAMLDGKTFTYSATYSGLSGPVTGAHFHGPAQPGANAGVVVPAVVSASPITGKAMLTDAQIADLNAGLWYFNIHTAANPAGEIRGQVMVDK